MSTQKADEIKVPIKFSQPSESTPAKTILVHISKMESFICSLNPAASLYEDVTDEDEIKKCFDSIKEYLITKNIQLITVEEVLSMKDNKDDLMKLAKNSLNYQRDTDIQKVKAQGEKKNSEEVVSTRKKFYVSFLLRI